MDFRWPTFTYQTELGKAVLRSPESALEGSHYKLMSLYSPQFTVDYLTTTEMNEGSMLRELIPDAAQHI